jgi:hypothetical protein
MKYYNTSIIKVNVMSETGEIGVEFINLAHITRFYSLNDYVVIELVNNVKLKLCDITIQSLCDKFFA